MASPKGGEAPLDQNSVELFKKDEAAISFLNNQQALWKNTVKLSDIDPKTAEYDAIFYVGGHGREFCPPCRPFVLFTVFFCGPILLGQTLKRGFRGKINSFDQVALRPLVHAFY